MKPKKGSLGLALLGLTPDKASPRKAPKDEDDHEYGDESDEDLDEDMEELEDDEANVEADEASEAVFDAIADRDTAGLQAALTDLLTALGY